MSDITLLLEIFALVLVANAAPVVANFAFGSLYSCPIDAGKLFFDNKPVFGPSKTIRGLLSSLFFTSIASLTLGLGLQTGIIIALFAMAGDLTSSFIKRRFGLIHGSSVPVLDQGFESLLPLLIIQDRAGLEAVDMAVIVAAFMVTDILMSRLLSRTK